MDNYGIEEENIEVSESFSNYYPCNEFLKEIPKRVRLLACLVDEKRLF